MTAGRANSISNNDDYVDNPHRRHISSALLSLLETEETMNDNNFEAKILQLKLCRQICDQIDQLENEIENANISNIDEQRSHDRPMVQLSVRMILSEIAISITTRQRIVDVLSYLISTRVDNDSLLPATMDEQANQEVLEGSAKAMTLTRSSMAAAELYCRLLALPGGIGLLQMDIISALANLIQRWNVELCGREGQMRRITRTQQQNVGNKKALLTKRSDNDNYGSGSDGEEMQPLKRGRFPRSKHSISQSCSDDESSNAPTSIVVTENDDGDHLSSFDLLTSGMNIAFHLIRIPVQSEFTSWSTAAKEIILKTTCTILATSHAIISSNSKTTSDTLVSAKLLLIAKKAAHALKHCIFDLYDISKDEAISRGDDDDVFELSIQAKRHEITKFVLRGLYPFICLDEVVPAGENGKTAAGNAACEVFKSFLEAINEETKIFPHLYTAHQIYHFSADAENDFATFSADKTPAMDRRNPKNKTRFSVGSLLSPKLKSSINAGTTPGTSRRVESSLYNPRPVVSLLLGFLQKLTAVTVGRERAANRTFAIDCIQSWLPHFPDPERKQYLLFVSKFGISKLSVHRFMGSELIGSIFSAEWLWEYENDQENYQNERIRIQSRLSMESSSIQTATQSSHAESSSITSQLFSTLKCRLSDRYPTIRACSAGALAKILRGLAEALSCDHVQDSSTENTLLPSSLSITRKKVQLVRAHSLSLVDILRRRILNDDKATVQRACIIALVELLVIGETAENFPTTISETDIGILVEICQESSLSTRKAALNGLTRLLEVAIQFDLGSINSFLECYWAETTLLMVLDSERTCSSKAVELFERIVLEPILSNSIEADEQKQKCAWRMLASVGDTCSDPNSALTFGSQVEGLRVALSKIVLSKGSVGYVAQLFLLINNVATKTLDSKLHDNLFAVEVEVQRRGVWCLFEAAMGYTTNEEEKKVAIRQSKIDVNFLTVSWDCMLELYRSEPLQRRKASLQRTMQQCLFVLSKLADLVDESLSHRTAKGLETLIAEFELPPDLIASAIAATVATMASYSIARNEDIKKNCSSFIKYMYGRCEREVDTHTGDFTTPASTSKIAKALFTIGEISMIGFSPDEDNKLLNDPNDFVGIQGLYVKPNDKIINIVQAFMVDTLPDRDKNQDTALNPSSIRAHAFVTFGKLCLRNERLAHQSLNILARELHQKKDPAVQSNSLLILGDLCVRYTNLVDRFLPTMAACLQSGVSDLSFDVLETIPSPGFTIVRKHAIIMLSNLILQDFIKWRGLLFHRFLVACADEDDDVANLAEAALTGPLIKKNPKLFSNQFVESIFVLNRCTAHPIYIAAASMGDGGSGISVGFEGINLSGDVGRIRRMRMYHLLLSRMSDEEKIGVTARIAKDVLDGAIKVSGDLNAVCVTRNYDTNSVRYESAFNVLSDAFAILASPSIRVGKQTNRGVDDDNDDIDADANINEPTNNAKKVQLAKGRLLSNISRKHMIDILLPTLCQLKSLLQKSCSCLLKDVMACLVVFYNLYKDEVKESLANDPTLLQELAYDARQYQKAQKQSVGRSLYETST